MSKPIQYQVLAEARLLIQNPVHWCSGDFAIGSDGSRLSAGSPEAAQHCAVSAIELAARGFAANAFDAQHIANSVMSMLAPVGSTADEAQEYVWSINDFDGHAAVIDLFDTALAMD
jgi:hypothetical protein